MKRTKTNCEDVLRNVLHTLRRRVNNRHRER